MSDGNINRKLIPTDAFQSGLRAGEARMRSRALKTFKEFLMNQATHLSEKEKEEALETFHKTLQ